jgi:hypothetical protein
VAGGRQDYFGAVDRASGWLVGGSVDGTMSRHEVAFTAAATAGLLCSAAAALGVWLLLTDPLVVTHVVAQAATGSLLQAAVDAARHAVVSLFQAL